MVLRVLGALSLFEEPERDVLAEKALSNLELVVAKTQNRLSLRAAESRENARRERIGLPVKGEQMGFFSNLLGFGKKVIGGLLGIAPAAKKIKPAVTKVAAVARRGAVPLAAGTVGLGAGLLAGDGAVDAAGRPIGGGVGGNGLTFTRTIVQSVDARDGTVLRQQVLQGSPHLMNRDLAVAKRVFRLAGKLHRRMPKRTVRMSRAKLLTQQVVENALERAALPCPTKG